MTGGWPAGSSPWPGTARSRTWAPTECGTGRRGLPVEADTIWRLASMTKPITSVAAMMLYEEGAFELKDPMSKWIPAFREMTVYRSGSSARPDLRPAVEPIRVWHLLTPPPGLTYGFHYAHPVDAVYRAAGFEWGSPGVDLAGCCEPGQRCHCCSNRAPSATTRSPPMYSAASSRWSPGQSLDEFFRERIFQPLGMTDTAFSAGATADRLAAVYRANPAGPDPLRCAFPVRLRLPAGHVVGRRWTGGNGPDYLRFALMLRGGGELDGIRLLSSRTVAYMTRNQLPGGVDLEEFGRPLFAETTFDGVGFGLGVSVVTNPAAAKVLCGLGEYGWVGPTARCLGGARGRPERPVLHPAAALEHPPHPQPAEATGLPGSGVVTARPGR